MMDNFNDDRTMNAIQLFDRRYIETKTLYLYYFQALPDIHYINCIDGEKAFEAFKEKFASLIVNVHKYRWYKHETKKFQFDKTIIILNKQCLIEFDDNYCEILHNGKEAGLLNDITAFLMSFKERQKRQPSEINIIIRDSGGLDLKTVEVQKAKLDISLYYEDNFKEVDEIIQKRLKQKKDKGIILLHGLPGTGKTTYLRYLIGKIKKRILFLSSSVAGNLMNPEFIDLLMDNPNTVLIIEDAEQILMDRNFASDSSVSGLLNISDGLLADFLNVQLICTFNSPLTLIDKALLRKGRLIANYEFGKLSIAKGQRLSDHLGFKNVIRRPMTLSEICNQDEKEFEIKQVKVLGFSRKEEKELLSVLTE